jgi:hypothetical protein
MRVVNGKNPDWADFDEIDQDVVDAREAFYRGELTPDQLRHEVGTEEAQALIDGKYGEEDSFLTYLTFDEEDLSFLYVETQE